MIDAARQMLRSAGGDEKDLKDNRIIEVDDLVYDLN